MMRATVALAGNPNAGKTTLLRALSQHNKKIRADIRLRKIGHIPFLISHTLYWLLPFLRQYRQSRWFTRRETRSMIYLKAWGHVLERQASNKGPITIFDQGPIFRLALLHGFGPEIIKSQNAGKWWATSDSIGSNHYRGIGQY